jgi:hypothetical protein
VIYELRTYTLLPGKLGDYLKLAADAEREVFGTDNDKLGKLEGQWYTEFGTLNQAVILVRYRDFNGRDLIPAEPCKSQEWSRFAQKIRSTLVAQETKILRALLPLKPPASEGNVYELRTYRTRPGAASEWLDHFKAIIPVRENYSKNVGLWQTQIGQLDEVTHMWVYRDLNERTSVRTRLKEDREWQAFLSKGNPLLLKMKSVVLSPTPNSAMK